MIRLLAWFSGLILGVISCTGNDSKNQAYTTKFTLQKTSEISFPLDSVTSVASVFSSRLAFYSEKQGDKSYVFLLNLNNNTLYCYNYKNQKLIYITPFLKDGPNGVGNLTSFSGFYVKTLDSIFVFNNQTGNLYLSDRNGKIKSKYNLLKKEILKNPNLTEFFAPAYYKDTIILNTWGAKTFYDKSVHYNNDLFTIFSLKNKSLSYSISYPKIYSQAIWGVQLHFMFNSYNPATSEIVSSFVIDDSISLWNLKSKIIKRKYAGASFMKSIKPLSTKRSLANIPDIEIEVKNQLLQNTYSSIYTDEYNGYTYRFVNEALSEEDYNQRDPQRKQSPYYIIIILDKNYDKIGEVKHIHFSYRTDKVFITENGLHILKLGDNENEMRFHIFQPKKI